MAGVICDGNKMFAGVTSQSGIIIRLKSGGEILILRSGEDFEVQRELFFRNVSYWAKQPEIHK